MSNNPIAPSMSNPIAPAMLPNNNSFAPIANHHGNSNTQLEAPRAYSGISQQPLPPPPTYNAPPNFSNQQNGVPFCSPLQSLAPQKPFNQMNGNQQSSGQPPNFFPQNPPNFSSLGPPRLPPPGILQHLQHQGHSSMDHSNQSNNPIGPQFSPRPLHPISHIPIQHQITGSYTGGHVAAPHNVMGGLAISAPRPGNFGYMPPGASAASIPSQSLVNSVPVSHAFQGQYQQYQAPNQKLPVTETLRASDPNNEVAFWSEHDTSDGRKYWYNSHTKTSTYEKPACLKSPEERSIEPCIWKEFVADGKKYYNNGTESRYPFL